MAPRLKPFAFPTTNEDLSIMSLREPLPLRVHNAPSSNLVLTWLGLGILGFALLGIGTAVFRADFTGFYAGPRFLAWVHMAILLWLNPIVFGVLAQFIPVVLDTRPGSGKLARWTLCLYLPGAVGMVVCFWIGRLDWPLHSFATFVWAAMLLAIWDWHQVLRHANRRGLTWRCLRASLFYLTATIMLGMFLSVHIFYPMGSMSHLVLMKAHANLGLVGWFLLVVIGVSLKLFPMFLLSKEPSTKPAAAAA